MKYRVSQAILMVVFIVPNSILAQDTDYTEPPQIFEGRLISGLNCTQVNGDTYAGYHKAGLNAGGMVYVHFTPSFGISMELLYTQKGVRGGNVKESLAWGTYFDKYYLNLNYAEAALLLHLNRYLFDYEAGVSYARLIRAKEWAEADVPVLFPPDLCYFNSADINYVAGISLRLRKRLRLNIRYQYSMIPIRPQERVVPRYNNGKGQYNEVTSFRLVYTL